jgi:nitrite reductase/ring-hydroxylating ferredoxin subunit
MPESVKVGSKKDVPEGGSHVFRVKDKEVAVFNLGGVFYALDNVCPHRGGPLGEGAVDGTIVTCPWHGWQFDVTTGHSPALPAAKAPCFKVTTQGDDLYVEV